MSHTVPVRSLSVGQVISLPGTDLEDPVLVTAASEPMDAVRFLHLADLYDGEPVGDRHCLNLDRTVTVHDVTAWHHSYRNDSNRAVEVTYGRRTETVEPGVTVHYTGVANPDAFPEGIFNHEVRPVGVERDDWPL